jgi:HlyD family secretion protein
VERVGLLVGRQNLVSDDTAANTDARVVEVLVRLDPDSSARAAGLSNLEAVARIDTGAPE